MRSLRSATRVAALVLAAGAPAGCGAQTFNVPASRAFANEDPDLGVVRDRTVDLERATALVTEALLATPYAPGDAWPRSLRIDGDAEDRLRARFEDKPPYVGEHDVALAKLYKTVLEEGLARARSDRAARPSRFPSVLDAAATLATGAADLPARFRAVDAAAHALARARRRDAALEQALLKGQQDLLAAAASALAVAGPLDGEKLVVARDALEVVAFALRLDVESLAVQPYVVKQAKRVQRRDGQGGDFEWRARDQEAPLTADRAALEPLANALANPAKTPLADTGGFAVHENVIVQAAKVNLDASHMHIKGDAEMLFYHELDNPDPKVGRTRRLAYSVDPVFLVGGRIIAAYDFLHVKNAVSLNTGYTTDRLFGGGGELENQNSLGTLLGLHGLTSDFFDIGMDLVGIHTGVRLATFTSGEVREIAVDPTTGKDLAEVGRAPFQLTYQQIDIGFDFTILEPDLAEDLYVECFLGDFRYMSYELPRILYEVRERTPAEGKGYVFERQTPPQTTRSKFFMGGFTLRLGGGDWPRVSPYADLGLYGGAGPASFYFTPDPTVAGGTREVHDVTMLALDGDLATGVRFRLTKRRRPRLVLDLSYHGELVGQGAVEEIRATKTEKGTSYTIGKSIDLGAFDLFHGPRLLLVFVM